MTSLRKTLAAAGLGLAVAVLATPAQAQFSIGLAGGGTTASGSINNRQDMGYNGLIALQAGLPLIPFRIRADLQYNSFGGSSFSNAFSQATAGTDARVISGSINAVIGLLPGPVKPYLIGGVGYYDTKFDGTSSSRKFGYNYGAGVRVTKLFIEARMHTVQNTSFDVANGRSTAKFIPVSVGFMF
ncbi:MAG: outer membrane beta-barrel protein [Gemmatimonadaceae bacterium]|nr:outer membrane beta-barrel protein [Gemmatimonadaceae bacterium]